MAEPKTFVNGQVLLASELNNLRGPFVCTSTTRPTSTRWAGLIIFETDTLRLLTWTGTAWVGISATDIRPPEVFNVTLSNFNSTAYTPIITQNSIFVAPVPLRMEVQVFGHGGASAVANTTYLQLVDGTGSNITLSAFDGTAHSFRSTGGDDRSMVSMFAQKEYAAGDTVGFRLQARVTGSGIYLALRARLSYVGLTA